MSGILVKASTTVLTNGLITAVTFGSGVVLARALGPNGRGDLAIAMLWPPVIFGIGNLGLADAVTYFAARGVAVPGLLSTSLVLAGVQSLLGVGVAALVLPLLLGDASAAVHRAAFLFLLYIPLAFVTGYPAAILQGKLHLWLFNAFRFSVHPTYTLLLLALWLAGRLTLASAVGASLSASAFALVLFLTAFFRSGAFAWRWDAALARSLLGFGVRVHAGNVAMLTASQLHLVVLAWLRPPADVGLYVAAGTVGGVMALVPSALGMVVFPVLASQPPIVRRQTLAALLRVGFPLSLLALLPSVLVLPWTMGLLFGPAFEAAEGTARLLVVAYFFRGWLSILASAIRALGRPLLSGLGEIVGLPVLLVTLLLFVPEHGHLGAAAAVAAAAASGASALMGVVIAEGVREVARPALPEAESEPAQNPGER